MTMVELRVHGDDVHVYDLLEFLGEWHLIDRIDRYDHPTVDGITGIARDGDGWSIALCPSVWHLVRRVPLTSAIGEWVSWPDRHPGKRVRAHHVLGLTVDGQIAFACGRAHRQREDRPIGIAEWDEPRCLDCERNLAGSLRVQARPADG